MTPPTTNSGRRADAERRAGHGTEPGAPRERRRWRTRHGLELALDSLFRPRSWAARLSYLLGLQGGYEVELSSHLIPLPGRAAAPPLRIGFASDFHAGTTTDRRVLESACETLAEARPDVLLLGGDFVSVRARYITQLAPLLRDIIPPLGAFAVLGNHDLRADRASLVRGLESAGVRLLTNEHVRLPAPHGDVLICGLDDPIHGKPDLEATLDGEDGVRVILMHAPDGLRQLGDERFALALCGHTHGGQIASPSGKAIVVPSGALSRRYLGGLYRLGDDGERALLVSRGIGCSTIPVRLFAPPEVHLITLG